MLAYACSGDRTAAAVSWVILFARERAGRVDVRFFFFFSLSFAFRIPQCRRCVGEGEWGVGAETGVEGRKFRHSLLPWLLVFPLYTLRAFAPCRARNGIKRRRGARVGSRQSSNALLTTGTQGSCAQRGEQSTTVGGCCPVRFSDDQRQTRGNQSFARGGKS